MRIDISTIEERNNALETKSDNNSALLLELQRLHGLLCTLEAAEAGVGEEVEGGGEALPGEYLSMRVVKEKRSELKRLKNTWMSRAKTFLISLFAESGLK